MVATEFDKAACLHRFLVKPNCSLSWHGVLRFYFWMVAVSLGIAIMFAFSGAWLVLPFAGLEMLVLGASLYCVSRHCASWQLITVDEDTIYIYESKVTDEPVATFQRVWAKVELQVVRKNWYPPRLMVGSHGKSIELGGFLSVAEREALAKQLANVLNASVRIN